MLGSPDLPRVRERYRRWTSPGRLPFIQWSVDPSQCTFRATNEPARAWRLRRMLRLSRSTPATTSAPAVIKRRICRMVPQAPLLNGLPPLGGSTSSRLAPLGDLPGTSPRTTFTIWCSPAPVGGGVTNAFTASTASNHNITTTPAAPTSAPARRRRGEGDFLFPIARSLGTEGRDTQHASDRIR